VGGGHLKLGRWRGAPVRAHWTLPLGAFVLAGGRFAPGFWIGFALIVLVHEIGHAILVRRYRCRVVSIDLYGMGGECRWHGDPTAIQRAKIAWGGVTAQIVALLAAEVALIILGRPASAFTAQLAEAFTVGNGLMIAINLIPLPPLDGAEAWKPFRLQWARRQRRRAEAAHVRRMAERELSEIEARDQQQPPARVKAAVDAAIRKASGGPREPRR
jgi:Zn-dependent protease